MKNIQFFKEKLVWAKPNWQTDPYAHVCILYQEVIITEKEEER